jgi:hypothetical protein
MEQNTTSKGVAFDATFHIWKFSFYEPRLLAQRLYCSDKVGREQDTTTHLTFKWE